MAEEIIVVRFKELYIASLVLFAIGIILVPINQLYSTLVLFGLVGLWTRIPTFFADFLKDLEQVDFLTIMIALNIGGWIAGWFGMVVMLFSRAFAPLEWPMYTMKDSLCFFVCGNLVPFIYNYWGGNLLLTAYTFTTIRYILYMILTILIEPGAIAIEAMYLTMGAPVAYLVNTGAITFFAPLTAPILKHGVGLNIELISIVLVILLLGAAAEYLNKKYLKKPKKEGHEMRMPFAESPSGIHS